VSCSTGRDLLHDSVLCSEIPQQCQILFFISPPRTISILFQLCMLSCILYAVGVCMQDITVVNNKLRSTVKITLVYKFVSALLYSCVGCSKSIRRDFFPRKLMKHGRRALVGRWRVPTCAYLAFFPSADSVSRVQPACE